jgi:hypothetical protein
VKIKANVVMAAFAAITVLDFSYGAHAETDREKELEARVNALEKTVQLLLKQQKMAQTVKPSKIAKHQPPVSAVPVEAPSIVTPDEQPVKPAQAVAQKGAESTQPDDKPLPQPGAQIDQTEPVQELNVLRNNTVTLKPRGIEISNETDYIGKETSLQRDRAIINNTTLRYGIFDWLEASATIPFGFTTRTTDVTQNKSVVYHTQGLGDISGQLNFRLLDQTDAVPGVVLSLGFQAPTGPDPYDFKTVQIVQQNQGIIVNPRNPLFNYFSQGSWVFHSNLQVFKTIDPVILFAGMGLDHVFPYTGTPGYAVYGFNRLIYNFGFSLALSEKTTLGFTVNGSYTPDFKVNGQSIFKSEQEPVAIRISLIQRIAKGWYFEPSMSFGVDNDAPNYIIGLNVRHQF